MFKLGKSLGQKAQDQFAEVIMRHLDAFAWSASNMPGIDPNFLCHHLTMDPQVHLYDREDESSTRRGVTSFVKRQRNC